jgi:hypothetical protein
VYRVITVEENPPTQVLHATTVETRIAVVKAESGTGFVEIELETGVLGQGMVNVTVVGVAAHTVQTVVVTVIPGGGT